MRTQWRCTVCGYIHEGEEPPDICPVCGVGSEKFVSVEEPKIGLLQEMMQTFQPHAVAAHFPNALLPTAVLFLLIGFVTGRSSFELAAFYLLVVALFSAPATMATGLYDWKTKFGGQKAAIFKRKIALATTLIILAIITVALRLNQPELMHEGGAIRVFYLFLIFAMLGCVTLLGHYGGKLVFSLMDKG